MGLESKYISAKDNAAKPDIDKIVLSNDAYAIVEYIELLIKKIERVRVSLI